MYSIRLETEMDIYILDLLSVKWFEYFNNKTWIWAAARQNQQNEMCAQQRLRSARTSAQSDQSLHCALNRYLRA